MYDNVYDFVGAASNSTTHTLYLLTINEGKTYSTVVCCDASFQLLFVPKSLTCGYAWFCWYLSMINL